MRSVKSLRAALLLMAGLALATGAVASGDHKKGHDHKPLHGGVVTEAKDVDYELVIKPDVIDIHVRDHGKPSDLSGGTAVLTLLVGTDKQEIKLAPASGKFTASGKFSAPAGTKAVAMITLRGKPAKSVRFALK